MRTMIVNTIALLLIAFAMFLIFKKIKSILPSFLGGALNREPVHAAVSQNDIETDSDNEDEMTNCMSNIIELDEEDIDVDDINSDDEIVLNKSSSDDETESEGEAVVEETVNKEEVVEEPVVEEPVVEEPVVKPTKKAKVPKKQRKKAETTIKI